MKLLLTSGGLTNTAIIHALTELTHKPLENLRLAFIPTAANVEAGNKLWLIKDLNNCKKAGFKEIDIVDISALPQKVWQQRLERADVLLFGGGNSFHLLYWLKKSGLDALLPELLSSRVYIGISAGSMVATKNLTLSNKFKKEFTEQIGEEVSDDALGFVPFLMRPHLNSVHFPNTTSDKLKKVTENMTDTVYALDDNSAIKVDDENITVVSEGIWEKFN